MSSGGHEDTETSRRYYTIPHSGNHPIPTVQKYRAFKEQQKSNLSASPSSGDHPIESKKGDAASSFEGMSDGNGNEDVQNVGTQSANAGAAGAQSGGHPDTSQVSSTSANPKEKRKSMKSRKSDNFVERKVTDPVTHLPVTIRDFNSADLKEAGDQREEDEEDLRLDEGVDTEHKSKYDAAVTRSQQQHEGMRSKLPSPGFNLARADMAAIYSKALAVGLGALSVTCCLWFVALAINPVNDSNQGFHPWRSIWLLSASGLLLTMAGLIIFGLSGWVNRKAAQAWEDSMWAARWDEIQAQPASDPESTKWLNNFIGSVWPMINPDLFDSLVDTLEDVMQASLPRFVRMVSVEDLGQGSEPVRFLGMKWLPHGAAAHSVTADGKTSSPSQDNTRQEEGKKKDEDETMDSNAGLQAEEGSFCNLEFGIAYQAATAAKKLEDRERNAHLYMAFYLPGGIKFPVWVELKGLVGIIRARFQLTADPPFVALCTISFLGQPKVNISCTPLLKRGLNLADLPVISSFIQSSIDAAINEYVAPKSLTLDLKAMISGDDFKHDTLAKGVVVVKIKRAFGFKAGDTGLPLIKKDSSDPYVSVSYAKFGRVLFSTRVLVDEMEPYFNEETFLLVSPVELDAEESVRLQLWDSDVGTADDDLGRLEVPLKEIMTNEKSNGNLWEREDTFQSLQPGKEPPGKVEWSVGYFSKVKLLDSQVKSEDGITTVEQLKQHSYEKSTKKLREAKMAHSQEAEQTKKQDFDELCTNMITTTIPSQMYPSGILSIQLHNIVGLELENLSRPREPDEGNPQEGFEEDGEHSPSSYCTVILNHQKIFKTRTKPRNSKPFFNASTERFVRDWRTASIMVAVRDARVHEEHPLIGLIQIDIGDVLRQKGTSRFCEYFPLAGGIGFGRIRISLVFRSIEIQPLPTQLGWEWGTIEAAPTITTESNEFPDELKNCRIKVHNSLGKGHLWPAKATDNGKFTWNSRQNRPIRLAVRKRASSVVLEFRSTRLLMPDQSPAFAVVWLHSLPDEEDVELELPVFRGDVKRAAVNALPEDRLGTKISTIVVKIRFFRGLGKWHGKLASKNGDIANVMEALIVSRDAGLSKDPIVGSPEWVDARKDGAEHGVADSGNDDSSSSSSDSDEGEMGEAVKGGAEHDENHHKGFVDKVREKKRHNDQLNRKHRGIMQFPAARTMAYLKHKVEHSVDKIADSFEHKEREPGVETEM